MKVQKVLEPEVRFPRLWSDFFDHEVTQRVKAKYSPKEKWADKPFSEADSRFFSKGVRELSELFQNGTARDLQTYLNHPKYRSSYLLYFLPLQCAKFLALLQRYPDVLARLASKPKLRILDLGAGPGTASLALTMALVELTKKSAIEFHWVDTQPEIMRDGQAILEPLLEQFPGSKIILHRSDWKAFIKKAPDQPWDLVLCGNVLNEGSARGENSVWGDLLAQTQTAGVLWVEPAERRMSQFLSQLRDEGLEEGWISPQSIIGPCLHAERCPMAQGRDWCHTSARATVPGQWFKKFSVALGSVREWLKYSYLWIDSPGQKPRPRKPEVYRAISDPMNGQILLCQPDRPLRIEAPTDKRIGRGDLVTPK